MALARTDEYNAVLRRRDFVTPRGQLPVEVAIAPKKVRSQQAS